MEDSDIRDYFDALLKQYGSVDIADDEFKKQIHEDRNLREMYRQYCHKVGSSEKNGFLDYCEEYLDSQDTIWDNLKDAYEDD
ncbi:MAG: hypothetical protein K2H83_01375 [Duncaniella sp.]|nr:hypothetical protein [Duncaniella sp.]MDE5733774.1 hypothetical protein [Duncaniella sp.]MDE6178828.1 hypothetical protein [Duncaniella sp.]MDE6391330.1 hypothetical protein [Duncaniella sp.]